MTIEELYYWAKENGVEKYNIEIQYRDGGGYYEGTEELQYGDVCIDNRANSVIL